MKTLPGGFVVLVTLCWPRHGAEPHPYSLGAARGRAPSEGPLVDRADVARWCWQYDPPHWKRHSTVAWTKVPNGRTSGQGHSRGGVCRRAPPRDVGRSHQGARRPLRQTSQELGGQARHLRDLAKDLSEWAIYAAIAILAITLWKRFPSMFGAPPRAPYADHLSDARIPRPGSLTRWRHWQTCVGILLAARLCRRQSSPAFMSSRAGRSFQTTCRDIASLGTLPPDLTEVNYRLDYAWPAHRPGQFLA